MDLEKGIQQPTLKKWLAVAVILSSALCLNSSDGPILVFGYELDFILRSLLYDFHYQFELHNLIHTFTVFSLIALQLFFLISLFRFRFTIFNLLVFILTPLLFVYYQLYQSDDGYYIDCFSKSGDVIYAIPFWIISILFYIHIFSIYRKEKDKNQ